MTNIEFLERMKEKAVGNCDFDTAVELRDCIHLLKDCGMMIRRLSNKLPDCELKNNANDFLARKGLQGSVLRE